jgi:hypothetical protein
MDDDTRRAPIDSTRYNYLARRFVLPFFGTAELAKVSTTDVRAWLASLRSTKLSPNTAATVYRLFARVMAAAVADGVVDRSLGQSKALRASVPPRCRSYLWYMCKS